jgi:GMC oxidoreductase
MGQLRQALRIRRLSASGSGQNLAYYFFCGAFVWRHNALLHFVRVCCGGSLPKRATHTLRVCESGMLSVYRAPSTSYFLLPTLCGISTSERPLGATASAQGVFVLPLRPEGRSLQAALLVAVVTAPASSLRCGQDEDQRAKDMACATTPLSSVVAPLAAFWRPACLRTRTAWCHVHGLSGLWMADASIMPDVVRANTNVTTMMIAERWADFIKVGQ